MGDSTQSHTVQKLGFSMTRVVGKSQSCIIYKIQHMQCQATFT